MTAYHPKASMIGATSVSTPMVLKPMPTGKLSPAQVNLAASRFPFAFYQYLTPRHEIELAEKMLVEMRARDAKNGYRRRLPPTEPKGKRERPDARKPIRHDGILYPSREALAEHLGRAPQYISKLIRQGKIG